MSGAAKRLTRDKIDAGPLRRPGVALCVENSACTRSTDYRPGSHGYGRWTACKVECCSVG